MNQILFATSNKHKLSELRSMLAPHFGVIGLDDIGCDADIPETADSFEGNALLKARWVAECYDFDMVAADDSGLEVEALNGAPGVFSARYAGPGHDDAANNARLLAELAGETNRAARFRTVIALVRRGCEPVFFEGIVEGDILESARGEGGFGYDCLFLPRGMSKSFAEATSDEKNSISHRGRATAALCRYLTLLNSNNKPAHD